MSATSDESVPEEVLAAARRLRGERTDQGWKAALEGRVKDGGTARCTAVVVDWVLEQSGGDEHQEIS